MSDHTELTDTDEKVPMRKAPRRQTVINPRIQLTVAALLVALVVITLSTFAALLQSGIETIGAADVESFKKLFRSFAASKFLAALMLGSALTIAVAMAVTHKIVGPIYRMTMFLQRVSEGTQVEPCSLRKGDAFSDLCDQVNEVTASAREEAGRSPSVPAPRDAKPASILVS